MVDSELGFARAGVTMFRESDYADLKRFYRFKGVNCEIIDIISKERA